MWRMCAAMRPGTVSPTTLACSSEWRASAEPEVSALILEDQLTDFRLLIESALIGVLDRSLTGERGWYDRADERGAGTLGRLQHVGWHRCQREIGWFGMRFSARAHQLFVFAACEQRRNRSYFSAR